MVMTVIFTTGIVSGCMPGDYNSIIAHAICYGCATNEETEKNHLHGEMVAYGLLILFIVDKQLDELNRWLPIYREIGWPTSFHKWDSMNPIYHKSWRKPYLFAMLWYHRTRLLLTCWQRPFVIWKL